MKKRSSSQKSQKRTVKTKSTQERVTIGIDLGDKTSRYCMLSSEGEILREGQVPTTKAGMVEAFGSLGRARIAIEGGTHSPWVSRLLQQLGHEMVVANPRQVKLITESSRKDDRLDAQTLARLARVDPQLLRPIQHRSDKAQGALMIIRVRAALMAARTSLVNTARGLAKSMGERLPKCDADQMGVLQAVSLPPKLRQVLEPLLKEVESLTEKIKDSDREIEQIARKDYPETALLEQVGGVGPLIALTLYSLSKIRAGSKRAGISAVMWGCGRGAAIRGRANRNYESRRRAIRICGRCWCRERTTSSAAGDRIPI